MSCGESKCQLCNPLDMYEWVERAGVVVAARHRVTGNVIPFRRRPFVSLLPDAPIIAEGNLAYEMSHPGKHSHAPVVHICRGCAERILGRRLRDGEVLMQEVRDARPRAD